MVFVASQPRVLSDEMVLESEIDGKVDGTSINQFVATAVADKISAMKTVDFFAKRSTETVIESAMRIL